MAERKEPKRPPGARPESPEIEAFDLADEPPPSKRPVDADVDVDAPMDPTEDEGPPPDAAEPSKGPKRPQVGSPEAPLPRLWKAEPDDEPEPEKPAKKAKKGEEPVTIKKKKNADKSPKAAKEGEPKGVLKEETPTFDTYDTRQRIRIIAGVGLTGVCLLLGFIIFKLFAPAGETVTDAVPPSQEMPFPPPAATAHRQDDEEARSLFERARAVAKNKNTELAVSLLKTVRTKYPKTKAADDAKEALGRPEQNPPLPLFLDRPAMIARAGDPPPPPPPAPPVKPEAVVDASKTAVASTTGATANIALPANPAEMPTAPPTPAANTSAPSRPAKPLPKGFRARAGIDTHESGWPLEVVGDRDGAPMVLIPGDTFIQGRDDTDANEAPAHKVVLGTYYIDRHEVTVRQFNLFQKEMGSRTERARALAKDPAHAAFDAEDDRPVVMVSARDAKDFADWAGKFLPTEAQWEAAARTPDARIYPWGPEPPAWNRPRAPRQIDPIMSFPTDVSPYGVYDLAGNAWEWTKDWYDPKYYHQFRGAAADNPAGPVKPRSQQLVVKGVGKDWTASRREGLKFDVRFPYLGFRCVLQVEGAGNAFEPPPVAPPPGQPAAPGAGKVVVPF